MEWVGFVGTAWPDSHCSVQCGAVWCSTFLVTIPHCKSEGLLPVPPAPVACPPCCLQDFSAVTVPLASGYVMPAQGPAQAAQTAPAAPATTSTAALGAALQSAGRRLFRA